MQIALRVRREARACRLNVPARQHAATRREGRDPGRPGPDVHAVRGGRTARAPGGDVRPGVHVPERARGAEGRLRPREGAVRARRRAGPPDGDDGPRRPPGVRRAGRRQGRAKSSENVPSGVEEGRAVRYV